MTWKRRAGPLPGYIEEALDIEVIEFWEERTRTREWMILFPGNENRVHRIEWAKTPQEVLVIIKKAFGSGIASDLAATWIADRMHPAS